MIPNPLNRNARHPHLAAEREAPPNNCDELQPKSALALLFSLQGE
jgi:hypothetical protein